MKRRKLTRHLQFKFDATYVSERTSENGSMFTDKKDILVERQRPINEDQVRKMMNYFKGSLIKEIFKAKYIK